MKRFTRVGVAALLMVLALFASACAGEQQQEAAQPAEGGGAAQTEAAGEQTEAMALNTECQVQLPAEGEGSAEGMTDDPVGTAASNNPALSTLVTAVTQANLVDTLNDTSAQYTVFAPVNDAFAKIPQEDLDAVLANNEQLTSILTLHVVPERLSAEELAGMQSVTTVQGQEITLAVENGTLGVNDQASVICPDVMTANATVHLIDTVMMPA